MFNSDGFNPYGYYPEDDDFEETFYGNVGGINNAFSSNQTFAYLNQLVSEVARQAAVSFKESLSELKENALLNELLFYVTVFALKMALYVTLRKGIEKNLTDL
jgi:NTP pyrophosphatase (non-canonical NTP hydrolase)